MRVTDVIDVAVVDALDQWRKLLIMIHVHQDKAPALFLNPLSLLGQLNELLAAEDSAIVS